MHYTVVHRWEPDKSLGTSATKWHFARSTKPLRPRDLCESRYDAQERSSVAAPSSVATAPSKVTSTEVAATIIVAATFSAHAVGADAAVPAFMFTGHPP